MNTEETQLKTVEEALSKLYEEKRALENTIAARKSKEVIALFNDKDTVFEIHHNTINLYRGKQLDEAIMKLSDGFNHFEAPISDAISLLVNDERVEMRQVEYTENYDDYVLNTVKLLKSLGVSNDRFSFDEWDGEITRQEKNIAKDRTKYQEFRTIFNSL